jgi:hypothetical protein
MDTNAFIAVAARLTIQTVDALAAFYAPNAVFTDPFQTVTGRTKIAQIYRSMFQNLDNPRFVNLRVLGAVTPTEVMIGWDFEFAFKPCGPRQSIAGASRLTLDDQGMILEHLDYWDASRLMQALPLVGRVIAWLRQKIGHADGG